MDRDINLNFFESITLDQMDQVKLMDRRDTKFWFSRCQLQNILEQVKDDYYLLQINSRSILPYLTTYFDTDDDKMFLAHHNGKLNRYKVRKRTYLESNQSFLEVKFKCNKGRTAKSRITADSGNLDITTDEDLFLEKKTPFDSSSLKPILENNFNRIMLVSRGMNERCTIDIDLRFNSKGNDISMDNLAIVELKTERNAKSSPLFKRLKDNRIKSAGFSKYVVGRAVTDNSLKQNRLKAKLRAIGKVLS